LERTSVKNVLFARKSVLKTKMMRRRRRRRRMIFSFSEMTEHYPCIQTY
jgi:hypothetical protein